MNRRPGRALRGLLLAAIAVPAAAPLAAEWSHYGGDPGGRRYSEMAARGVSHWRDAALVAFALRDD